MDIFGGHYSANHKRIFNLKYFGDGHVEGGSLLRGSRGPNSVLLELSDQLVTPREDASLGLPLTVARGQQIIPPMTRVRCFITMSRPQNCKGP